jgi:glycosyltransferase involved in cell wall biosynthesis
MTDRGKTPTILFLHHNFPGQFKHLAQFLAKSGWSVIFLAERNFYGPMNGVKTFVIKSSSDQKSKHPLYAQLLCSERYRSMLIQLRERGVQPDIIVSHSGWGCGLYAKSIFAKARLISYMEWWFKHDADDYDYDSNSNWISYDEADRLSLYSRNSTIALELSSADAIVCPTKWQLSQSPAWVRDTAHIIHEGVDTNFFVPNPKWKPENKVRLTYATRGMEPMRGFPEFVEILPELLDKNTNLEVYIAGSDRIVYGSKLPPEGSFGKWAAKCLKKWIDSERVVFCGSLSLVDYARLLKSSHVHCYLSRPYVASWSLLESMATACYCIASDVTAITEITGGLAKSVDHRSYSELSNGVQQCIDTPETDRQRIGLSLRERVNRHWNKELSLQNWHRLLLMMLDFKPC